MDYCNVYINEVSAKGQYTDAIGAEQAVRSMLDCLSLIDSCDSNLVTVKKYYLGNIYNAMLAHNINLQNIRNKDLRMRFKLALKSATNWTSSSLTDREASYLNDVNDVTMTSMSEAYEQTSPMLVNFVMSNVTEPLSKIDKNGTAAKEIRSYSDVAAITILLFNYGWRKKTYDSTSSIPPRDEESILANTDKFEPTEYRYKGSVMYRRKGTNHLCYIDTKHYGISAHIEEFDEATKNMVCTLKINDDAIHHKLSKNEKGRKLKIENI